MYKLFWSIFWPLEEVGMFLHEALNKPLKRKQSTLSWIVGRFFEWCTVPIISGLIAGLGLWWFDIGTEMIVIGLLVCYLVGFIWGQSDRYIVAQMMHALRGAFIGAVIYLYIK